jgi:hypothetical protein
MGDFAKPRIDTFDPTPQAARDVQSTLIPFMQQFGGNPASYMQLFQNPAIQQAGQQMAGLMNNNPEHLAFQQAIGIGSPQTFANGFNELQNQFGDLGAVNRAEQTLQAGLPMFDRNLQAGMRGVNTSAPNRFSSRLAEEGRDVTTQALQDYNLFANNALMQGQQLQSQERNNALNFQLGARNLQQGAVNQTNQANLQGRQNQIQGAGVLGQLAANAGNNPFQRAMGMGQFGLDATSSVINPTMQFLMGMMGFAQPQGQQAIVGQSPLGTVLGAAGTAAGVGNLLGWRPFGNGGQQAGGPQAPGGNFGPPGQPRY